MRLDAVYLADPRTSWRGRRLLCAAALVVSCGLAGCAGVEGGAVQRDLRLTSDSSDADRLAQVRLELASGYFARGQTVVALDEVKRALAARPGLAPAHELRGLIHAQLGESALAEDSFRRALQLAPRSADAMHNYGWFLCQQRRWSEADTWFARASEQPGYLAVERTGLAQGVCQGRAGDLQQARQTLSRVVERDPRNPVSVYPLAEVLFLLGDDAAARAHLQRLQGDAELNAQVLWLAVKVERRLGDRDAMQHAGRLLVARFPASAQAVWYREGRFDE
jgi:type IV pilus assembly protein PilF